MIRPIPEATITLRPRPASGADVPASDLAIAGHPAAQPLTGVVLEAAFECDGRHLLFLTDDIPCEESLRIHLLDADGQLLDSATLGATYSTGSFELLRLEQPGTVTFRFFGDTDWAVEGKVHGNPQPQRSR